LGPGLEKIRTEAIMKIRNHHLIRFVALIGATLIRLWIGTLRYRYRPLGPSMDPTKADFRGRFIYCFWHENILMPAYQYGRPDIHVLISQHADGEIIAEICRRLKFSLIRGSTTRGGVEAVRQVLRMGDSEHIAITPDGPRGPRRQVQQGLIYLAARTGLPIVAFGIGFQRARRLRSWDRFALPRPWSFATCVTGLPITVPVDVDREALEKYRLRVQDSLDNVTELAEQWAENGEWPELVRAA
jgi:lysophospholipid acyltransferase (LPLAT)-like uncharacterized protein